jgi:Domain of unknown function (DUF1833)
VRPDLTDAIKEAWAMAPTDVVFHETIEISHPNISGQLRFVAGLENLEAWTEDQDSMVDDPTVFEAGAFKLSLPAAGKDGIQELNIALDNVDRRVGEFCRMAANFDNPVTITYRPYLSTDLTEPQMDPPLLLFLKEVTITEFQISGRATFADIVNKKFPSQLYTRSRFPSLGTGR